MATSLRANCTECTRTWAWAPTSTTSSTISSRRRTRWWTWASASKFTSYRWVHTRRSPAESGPSLRATTKSRSGPPTQSQMRSLEVGSRTRADLELLCKYQRSSWRTWQRWFTLNWHFHQFYVTLFSNIVSAFMLWKQFTFLPKQLLWTWVEEETLLFSTFMVIFVFFCWHHDDTSF